MATIWEPPALLSLAALLGVTGGALYYGLRPALRGGLPVVTNERDEVWGTEDPPPPPKRPYVYPADRIVQATAQAVAQAPAPPPEILAAPSAELEPHPVSEPPEVLAVAPVAPSSGVEDVEEEELSLADLFRARRRPQPQPAPHESGPRQPDATPKD